jgi:Pyridoxamine 5'-phosphate oxidase
MSWHDLGQGAPEIARLGRQRLDGARVALLGTLREDGSPRISPIEPYFAQGELLFGAMAWSLKVRDLQRDPRCVVHSAISGPDRGEGELRLYARAEMVVRRWSSRRGASQSTRTHP